MIALIGTTVVPYNLFLHAAPCAKVAGRDGADTLAESRVDTVVAITLGGVITLAIPVTAVHGTSRRCRYRECGDGAPTRTPARPAAR